MKNKLTKDVWGLLVGTLKSFQRSDSYRTTSAREFYMICRVHVMYYTKLESILSFAHGATSDGWQ